MNLYICTFGISSELSDKFQPIVADDKRQAELKMFQVHGRHWANCYTESEFDQSLEQGIFKELKPLKTIYVKEAI